MREALAVRAIGRHQKGEFRTFFVNQVRSSVFPLFIFAAGAATLPLGPGRYDVLLVLCLGMQVALVASGLESWKELAVISVYHGLGLGLELYKVRHGSWQYPGDAVTKFAGVPLFSGFMYASVASYVMQAWRRFGLVLLDWPKWPWTFAACAAIYANFFLNRMFADTRWWIVAGVLAVFARTKVEFTTVPGRRRQMPMVVAFFAIGCFVWLAEQVCTWLHIWSYPDQVDGWTPVGLGKLSSWCLLVIVGIVPVATFKLRGTGIS
ncbi:MAG: DUF817 domain-containing protein [Armatimonadetes bacterium]|nr:DUF817 domain-containing protein [Armatimonadota bacterium]